MTGIINRNSGGAWINSRDNVIVEQSNTATFGTRWSPIVGIKTPDGHWALGTVGGETLMFIYDIDTNYSAGNNTPTHRIDLPNKSGTIALTNDIPTNVWTADNLKFSLSGTTLTITTS